MAKVVNQLLITAIIIVIYFQLLRQTLAGQECDSNPCPNNATCINGIGAYSCRCSQGYFGSHCSLGLVNNGDVRLVDGRNSTNGNVQVYYNGRWGGICGYDWNFQSARVVCRQLGFDLAVKIYCCSNFTTTEITPLWLKNIGCRGNECSLSRCSNLNWGSIGNCDSYSNNYAGVQCAVDSCSSIPCINGLCISRLNSGYTCECNSGWKGHQCETREGSDDKPDETKLPCYRCDRNAVCHINSNNVSYSCTCKPGYIGNGLSCKELRLYPYGPQYGDISVGRVDDRQYRIYLRSPIQFTNAFYRKVYVSMNGFISFVKRYSGRPNRPFTSEKYPPLIAPFYADADARQSSTARIYINQYSSLSPSSLTTAILRNATNDVSAFQNYVNNNPNTSNLYGLFNRTVSNFHASLVTIITWHKVIPFPSKTTAKYDVTNTFQLVLISNGVNLFASFIYDDKGMNWWQRFGHIRPRAGFASQVASVTKYAYELPNSNTKELLKIDSIVGNYGKKGRWMFRVDDPASDRINYADRCQNWYANEADPIIYLRALRNRHCPCSSMQAIRDRRFRFNFDTFCARSTFPTRASNGERIYQQCCYSTRQNSLGSLLTTYPYGSSFIFRDHVLQNANKIAYRDCCVQSSMCNLYAIKRPINRCSGYRPPRRAWFWGDPHIRTLDGNQYTFNGLGEYVLLQTDDRSFILQGRTMQALNNGNVSAPATVLSGFATISAGADTVQFTLNSTLNGINILVNRTRSFSMHSMSNNETREFNNVDLAKTSTISVAAIFSSGISLEVTLLTQMLTIAFNAPDEIKGKTSGLLGTWNDNTIDDFKRPDGSFLDIKSNSSQIFYDFGQLWMINASDSLFTYPSGKTAKNYRNLSFIPVLVDNITELFTDKMDFYDLSVMRCKNNSDCLFDAGLTMNLEAAVRSKDTSEIYKETSQLLENFPPDISGLTTFNVTYGQIFHTRFNVTDKNQDDILTVQIIDAPDNSYFDTVAYTFTWNVSNYQNISFKFVATDSKGARSEFTPQIILCYCPNNGTCDYTVETARINNIDVVECVCDSAWTGDNCTQDYDACSDQPCFDNVTCIDNIVPLSGYQCGDCPSGYTGDGLKCHDYDECEYGTHQCNQTCINEEGTYTCECQSGYMLESDNRGCLDIDECAIGSHNCSDDAICINQPGSYDCICKSGYLGDGRNCTEINECKINNGQCNQICQNTPGSYKCSCYPGYEISSHYHTCVDINECLRPQANQCDQKCVNTQGSYRCQCGQGFKLSDDGLTCTPLSQCASVNNCTHTCTMINGLQSCSCRSGFKLSQDGRTCRDINECTADNLCNINANCINIDGSYQCICKTGYQGYGITCNDVNECTSTSTQHKHNCSAHANCYNTKGSYGCQCKAGYKGDGLTCQDIDECSLNKHSCSAQATCTNNDGSYTCKCKTGYTGSGFNCFDIDECNSNLFHCAIDGACINNNGSYQCKCQTGFSGDGTTSCTDINECLNNQNKCDTNADCQNTRGSYTCRCRSGYYGNGNKCTKSTYCSQNRSCGKKATCASTDTGYYCICRLGYYSSNDQLAVDQYKSDSHCQPGQVFLGTFKIIDQFKPGLAILNSNEHLTLSALVIKALEDKFNSLSMTKMSFKRVTITSFTSGNTNTRIVVEFSVVFDHNGKNIDLGQLTKSISGSNTTIDRKEIEEVNIRDYNECASRDDNLCASNQTCVNLHGSYSCKCLAGYTGSNCIDINECITKVPCGGNATCTNTKGSYSCYCPVGYHGDPYKGCYFACTNDYCLNGGTCIQELSARQCICVEGFIGDICAKKTSKVALTAIVSASIGSVGAVVLIIIILVCCFGRRRRKKDRADSQLLE
ncbi:uncharacterized protein TRIADDRAFT_54443 [Trichoplax adhaerens]|uniref:Mucin-like protein n=1 Tax=Trichoplax adhaerens TaxID=10228 RepID=B3RS17_TRIAD|nr:hypothetical protein TRIADDRAFT_54443 [Trichoplax adhaerens]EDV26971.1 hypothetical protein TRIADDRAFT_54443 [Trichoplax adhaerens]|eukprot:XP_002110967.1 hypothetical protein TRIADDRAFT_54443 [Trichoplax adhaerens]